MVLQEVHWRGHESHTKVSHEGHTKVSHEGDGVGLENPMVDPFVQLTTKHSSVELSW